MEQSSKHLAEISPLCDVALVAEFGGKSLSFKHMIEPVHVHNTWEIKMMINSIKIERFVHSFDFYLI